MLASTLGIEFDPSAAWNERKKVYEHTQLIIESLSITAAAQGDDARIVDLRGGGGRVPVLTAGYGAQRPRFGWRPKGQIGVASTPK